MSTPSIPGQSVVLPSETMSQCLNTLHSSPFHVTSPMSNWQYGRREVSKQHELVEANDHVEVSADSCLGPTSGFSRRVTKMDSEPSPCLPLVKKWHFRQRTAYDSEIDRVGCGGHSSWTDGILIQQRHGIRHCSVEGLTFGCELLCVRNKPISRNQGIRSCGGHHTSMLTVEGSSNFTNCNYSLRRTPSRS